jgi:hypothetical protein
MSRLRLPALVFVLAAFVTGATGAPAVLPQQQGAVDLLSQANLQLDGAVAFDQAGASVANAGDVNGDGIGDLVVGAPDANRDGRGDAGVVHVVFGRSRAGTVDLAALGDAGFTIVGAATNDEVGTSVAGPGDVNGDGRPDLLLGAPGATNNGRGNSGTAYVVFGKASTTTIDLAALGAGGFRIDGAIAGENAGTAVAAAGDVNGDGRPDLLVGSPEASNELGAAYVVFGKASTTTVDLANLGTGGFAIVGAVADDEAGTAVAGAGGDVNGDGRSDVVVGSPFADNRGRAESGSAYVVFGKASTTTVDLAALGAGGFRIDGAAAGEAAGLALAAAGDANGDGRPDLAIGAPGADANGRVDSGSAYVVFGKASTATVDLAALGGSGFRIDGATAGDLAGLSVSGPGDVNGDGRPDVLVAAPDAGNNGRFAAGSAYVIFGRSNPATVDLRALGGLGIRIDGAATGDQAGVVSGAGDVNGDGRPDVLVGAPEARNNGRSDSGSAYVVYGFGEPRLAYAPLQAQVGRALEGHRPSQLQRTGQPSFRVTPPLPAGLRLEGLGVIAGTPTEAQERTTHRVTMTDLAGEVTAALVLTVAPPPDTTAPRLVLSAVSPQPASRRGDVRVRATCDEPCTLRASGQIVIAGSQTLRLLPVRASLSRAGGRTLVLRLTGAGMRRLAAASARGLRARAVISVRAVDGAGNAVTRGKTMKAR